MKLEIKTEPVIFDIYGFQGTALNKDYAGTAFRLMDRMWKVVKSNNLKHKGLNIWVYENSENVFAGLELEVLPMPDSGLQRKTLCLSKYAYYKHVGPYNLIKQAGNAMTNELKSMGLETTLPYIEVYGHWTSDEAKLETELYISLL